MRAILIIMFGLIPLLTVNGQSIRKDHREMNSAERNAFVALLKLEVDMVNDLGDYHDAEFFDIHFNYRDNQPNDDVFLAWHRYMIFELEQKLQAHCPCISIPYWDWTTDASTSSSLWDAHFMGEFDGLWGLNRSVGGSGSLPTTAQVNSVQSIAGWADYTSTLESSVVHTGGHGWVGGIMNSGASPKDPIFYLHHGMVDKLWDEWQSHPSHHSSYFKNSMPRYDGTFTRYDGFTLPTVNPNNIIEANSLGVFFAENQSVYMEDYEVTNHHRNNEVFYYQYPITLRDDFITGANSRSEVHSSTKIVMKPGSKLSASSQALLRIDQCDFSAYGKKPENRNFYTDLEDKTNVYEQYAKQTISVDEEVYITQSADQIHIEALSDIVLHDVYLYSISGQLVQQHHISTSSYVLDLSGMASGVYSLHLQTSGGPISKLIIKP